MHKLYFSQAKSQNLALHSIAHLGANAALFCALVLAAQLSAIGALATPLDFFNQAVAISGSAEDTRVRLRTARRPQPLSRTTTTARPGRLTPSETVHGLPRAGHPLQLISPQDNCTPMREPAT